MNRWDARGPLRRPLAGVACSTMAVAAFFLLLTGLPAKADEPWDESEPRLKLAGNRAVHAGELIELQWTPADSVSELEILLSVDGGRHYSQCISPQLDPRECKYIWRVPELGGVALRMRIRFNRGGREIEGAPTAPLVVAPGAGQGAEPMGLPASEPRERSPRPSGRGEAPSGRAALGATDAEDEELTSHHPFSQTATAVVNATDERRSAPRHALLRVFAPPRVLPLRA